MTQPTPEHEALLKTIRSTVERTLAEYVGEPFDPDRARERLREALGTPSKLLTMSILLDEALPYLDWLATGAEIDWAYSGQEPGGYVVEMDNNIAERGGPEAIRDLIRRAHEALGWPAPPETEGE